MKTGTMGNKGSMVKRGGSPTAKNTRNKTGGKGVPGNTHVRGGNTKKPFAQLPGKGKAKRGGGKISLRKAGA